MTSDDSLTVQAHINPYSDILASRSLLAVKNKYRTVEFQSKQNYVKPVMMNCQFRSNL